ncbi:hypothetical protein DK419_05950 [Methylobacterium terrae]|uniref:Methyltransferase domain-containing protein n=1 Tax=Methylobacterium terrae TaxID=2202827 RepID=A0A2U8WK19_9HYPH|nr:methyltransferase domain-containing protein [Methylobacterium terrae]AWN45918.1 hypothetical protein DK419_05950 [Methylobacterium terrae]
MKGEMPRSDQEGYVSDFELPDDYVTRKEEIYFDDVPQAHSDIIYQPEVYDFAEFLLKSTKRSKIIDIGCGSGRKLCSVQAEKRIGIDFGPNIAACKDLHGNQAEWHDADFTDASCISLSEMADYDSVVVCADVVEHIIDPGVLIALLKACFERGAIVVTSTPDRIRVRGDDHRGPPPNPSHIREWSLDEYKRLLIKQGLVPLFAGYTISDNINRQNKTIITIHDIRLQTIERASPAQRPLAIIAAYNEADVIEEVIADFVSHGCDVRLIDNWSSDGTWEAMLRVQGRFPGAITAERYPAEGPEATCEWQAILRRKAEIAAEFPGRWIIHSDADELRRCPFEGRTLAEGLSIAEDLGCTRVDFNVVNYLPTDEREYESGTLEKHFNFYEYETRSGHFPQKNAWLQGQKAVDLASTGGHTAVFPGAIDFCYRFLVKHYPIRSENHGRRKILTERQGRWSLRERQELGWHTHHDKYDADSRFTFDRSALLSHEEFWADNFLLLVSDLVERRVKAGHKP